MNKRETTQINGGNGVTIRIKKIQWPAIWCLIGLLVGGGSIGGIQVGAFLHNPETVKTELRSEYKAADKIIANEFSRELRQMQQSMSDLSKTLSQTSAEVKSLNRYLDRINRRSEP